ncbi:SAM-dependent methyltransferase [Brevundimonas sp. LM2]|uniref:class I SAM-dependent DNA methyltransferase n=1 Tax=Brevundimonas sp. LM2 TaxID=1938605 RepID=UPI00098404C4|nr:DNA methyltransferase [Brevundimonas sp. LM2]AQR62783.1 SAM-dependent methyltransferase [Brevundimonas sp. LM2]
MTPADFIAKWNDATLRERQGSQMHFLDLCALLDQPQPTDPDRYCFERGATKAGGDDGWADVWRRGCFAWEYKGPHKDLDKAFRQLATYVSDLENPPYLVTSDMSRIIVRTNFTNTVTAVHEFALEDLRDPAKRDLLRQIFEGSEKLKPTVSPQELTAKAVERFAELGRRLQDRRTPADTPLHDPRAIAHFLNQLVFCMFAEDARLLPDKLFTKTIRGVQTRPALAQKALASLFKAMASEEEDDRFFLGVGVINWFNGGLFDGAEPLLLEAPDLKLVADTADEHDWSEIDPAIFGTMFEEALKATRKRAALGAHYTDRAKILKIVNPVIVWPLEAEWAAARAEIAAAATAADEAEGQRKTTLDSLAAKLSAEDADAISESEAVRARQSKNLELFDGVGARRLPPAAQAALRAVQPKLKKLDTLRDEHLRAARDRLETFLQRLGAYRVLDPACGSGNFLYVALHALKDLELKALIEAERLTGLQSPGPRVSLSAVRGIEIEPYAAELARVTLWIGDLQWSLKNGYRNWPKPILAKLDQIENRDALLNPDGTEAEWLERADQVDVLVGNPPFVGGKKQQSALKQNDLSRIRSAFEDRVPADANLVAYWFFKATQLALEGRVARFGFITTQAIRRGASRSVVQASLDAGLIIFDAWSNELWNQDGAQVRVSFVNFAAPAIASAASLDGENVERISADLRADVAQVRPSTLSDSLGVAAQGTISGGPFEVPPTVARDLLAKPLNPNARPNADVLRHWVNGDDLTDRRADWWIIDFGEAASDAEACLYEQPYELLRRRWAEDDAAKIAAGEPLLRAGEPRTRARWWILQRRRNSLLSALWAGERFLATPRVSKHRFFVWLRKNEMPDTRLVVFRRTDDAFHGLLEAKHHRIWSLRFGGNHGVGNDSEYMHTSTFDTFPFPEGLTPNIAADDYAKDPRAIAIAEAARDLNEKREAWLNPADLVRFEPEVVPGYPERVLPVSDEAAKVLKTLTMTNLYNQRPEWLDMAHRRLDAAVAAAYGWPSDLTDKAVLEHLFALNQERAAAGR